MNIFSYIPLIIAVAIAMSVHEMAHALVSYLLGDPTAKLEGRLSLNPLRHIDWAGVLCLAVFGFGWAKPVPIDSRYYKDTKTGIIWTSFAGPLANFIVAFISLFLFYALQVAGVVNSGSFVLLCLENSVYINIGLFIFNLIPIPPLDGSKILYAFLPDELYYKVIQGSPLFYILFIGVLYSGILSAPMAMLRGSIIDIFSQVTFFILGI